MKLGWLCRYRLDVFVGTGVGGHNHNLFGKLVNAAWGLVLRAGIGGMY